MKKPVVVIVSGPPAAGKTSIVHGLARGLELPLIAKDDLKESLFESLGIGDIDWSRKLGAATWEQLFLITEKLLEGGTSFVVESNFEPEKHNERLRILREKHTFTPVEVHVTASEQTLTDRFTRRITDTERHPGHHEPETPEEAAAAARSVLQRHVPLRIGDLVFVVTTDEGPVDTGSLVREIRASLS